MTTFTTNTFKIALADTATNKDLIGVLDFWSSLTLQNGSPFLIDFLDSLGAITI